MRWAGLWMCFLLVPTLAWGESSSIFVRVDTATGRILSAQTLRPPLDLTKARQALPAGQDFIPLDNDPNAQKIISKPDEWAWTGTTMVSTAIRLRLTSDKTMILQLGPGEAPTAAHTAIVTGQLEDAQGVPIPTTLAPLTVEVPHPRGGTVLGRLRFTSGVLEFQHPVQGTWRSQIPLTSKESGRLDLVGLRIPGVTLVSPPVIEVIRVE